jgi:hypothetical protein
MRIVNDTNDPLFYSRLSPTVGSGTIDPHRHVDLNLPTGDYNFVVHPETPNHVYNVKNAPAGATVTVAVKVT